MNADIIANRLICSHKARDQLAFDIRMIHQISAGGDCAPADAIVSSVACVPIDSLPRAWYNIVRWKRQNPSMPENGFCFKET